GFPSCSARRMGHPAAPGRRTGPRPDKRPALPAGFRGDRQRGAGHRGPAVSAGQCRAAARACGVARDDQPDALDAPVERL
ncbi:MAG: hypothetical protein AVDCRST_MAG52-982, partial [uncultured Blastococcus sp.]